MVASRSVQYKTIKQKQTNIVIQLDQLTKRTLPFLEVCLCKVRLRLDQVRIILGCHRSIIQLTQTRPNLSLKLK